MRSKRCIFAIALAALAAGCTSDGGSKVLQDFGLQERPDDYVSGSDRVMTKLPDVGKAELPRLNSGARAGEVLYEKTDALHGAYYKKARVYEEYRPLDANFSNTLNSRQEVNYIGYIEYTYQIYESPRRPSRVEAMAEIANIPTGERDAETMRYRFTSGGTWDGAKGEPVKLR
jgi:hypothetical protein